MTDYKVNNAYQYCMAIANSHYENFPVASRFLNKKLRLPVSAVYAFARTADDFADEGELTQEQRCNALNQYVDELRAIEISLTRYSQSMNTTFKHTSQNLIFIALADTIYKFKIPIQLFYDLLAAFIQDIKTTRYHSFEEVLCYCEKSANPVGRILLYLNKSASSQNLLLSDKICTGLQLINFYQDIAQDINENNRLYIPLNVISNFGVSTDDLRMQINNSNTQALLQSQLEQTRRIYHDGKPLCFKLSGRFAIEIRMIFTGGDLILKQLIKNTANIYQRPRLSGFDKFKILWGGVFFS
ncbi:MAG: squalene synthase HpnC [Gammaproteobacteria bacterium]|nr:squalene synthase HpnC [Gammaproteobacteria bacterium]